MWTYANVILKINNIDSKLSKSTIYLKLPFKSIGLMMYGSLNFTKKYGNCHIILISLFRLKYK